MRRRLRLAPLAALLLAESVATQSSHVPQQTYSWVSGRNCQNDGDTGALCFNDARVCANSTSQFDAACAGGCADGTHTSFCSAAAASGFAHFCAAITPVESSFRMLTWQYDQASGARCYRSLFACHAAEVQDCGTAGAAGGSCVLDPSGVCGATDADYSFYCPASPSGHGCS